MKMENEKKFTSKEEAKQTIKKIGMVLSVVTFLKIMFWIVVDTVAFKTLFQFIIRDEMMCLFLSGICAFCASALIYMVYRVAMKNNVDPESEGFRRIKALCWGFTLFGICTGLMVAIAGVQNMPLAMILSGVLGVMPAFSQREAVKMACERLVYDQFAKYTIDKAPDE